MRLNQGRIGRQESASMTAMTITACAVFLLDSQKTYTNGNASYVSLPLAIALSVAPFLLLWAAMKRAGAKDLTELADRACGKLVGGVLSALAVLLLFLTAWRLLDRFTTFVHSFVMASAEYVSVLVWVVGVSAYLAYRGLECVSRMAKIFGAFLGVLLLFGIFSMGKSLDFTRLSPFPGDIAAAGRDVVARTAEGFPVLLGLLCIAPALQGEANIRRTAVCGAAIAAVLTGLVQLGLGMAYTYHDLREMYVPMYRLKMILTRESYWFRLDQISLYIWLIGGMLSAAYCLYVSSLVATRRFCPRDVRPATVSLCALVALWLYLGQAKYAWLEATLMSVYYDYGYLAAVPFLVCAVVALVRFRKKRSAQHEKA